MSRLADNVEYPKTAYLDMAIVFFGVNFAYHKFIFRQNLSKGAFGMFLLVNMFTSYSVVEAFHPGVIRYYSAALNNTLEFQHRSLKTQILRKNLFGSKLA